MRIELANAGKSKQISAPGAVITTHRIKLSADARQSVSVRPPVAKQSQSRAAANGKG